MISFEEGTFFNFYVFAFVCVDLYWSWFEHSSPVDRVESFLHQLVVEFKFAHLVDFFSFGNVLFEPVDAAAHSSSAYAACQYFFSVCFLLNLFGFDS